MNAIARRLAALALALLLAGCATPGPQAYRAETPVLDPRTYFDGTVEAWGMFQDRFGRVVKRFTVTMTCTWDGDTGTLDEAFLYSDGTRQRRVWTLKRQPDGRWTGTADDVVGAASGEAAGNALNWRYTMALPIDGRTWHVQFDDWMFRLDDQHVVNRAEMSKFGIRLGEVTLFFRRPAP